MVSFKRFFISLSLSLSAIGLFSSNALAHWPWHPATHDLWGDIAEHFTLVGSVPPESIQPEVDSLLQNKALVRNLARNAKPFLYYVYHETQSDHMPAEIALLPMIESQYMPFAYSQTGATGLWQMMPGTAAGYHLSYDWWFDERRDTVTSTTAALSYLQYLHGYFHDWLLAIAAYNAGEGRIMRAVRRNLAQNKPVDFWSLSLPKETRIYVPKLLALAEVIAHRETFQLSMPVIPQHSSFTEVSLPRSMSLSQLARNVGLSEATLRTYNAGFRRSQTGPHWSHVYFPVTYLSAYERWKKRDAHARTINHKPHYRVQKGDTLAEVAYREQTTVSRLKSLNKLSTSVIHPGQVLLVPGVKQMVKAAHQMSIRPKAITEEGIPGPKHVKHVVKRHDSFQSLAKHYRVRVSQLEYWNNRSSHRPLKVGQVLHIWLGHHGSGKHYYRVKTGDSLGLIALRHGVSVKKLRHWNHLNTNMIRVGQRLAIMA